MRVITRGILAAAAALAVLSFAAGPAGAVRGVEGDGGGGAAFDYLSVKGLSQPTFAPEQIKTEVVRLPAFDGVELYLEITKPEGEKDLPVILEASPYHGTLHQRTGTRILPNPRDESGNQLGLRGFFSQRGYAVVMFDLRGTGRSRGCLDHLGVRDARDLKQVVEWAAAQDWSNGRVGMTGHSYVGSTPIAAAAQDPKGLATIVPSAGLASMYHHQFQAGVPYYLQWVGPMEAYEELAINRKLPGVAPGYGDDFGNNMEDTGCGLPYSALVAGEDQLSGRYADWHAQRDWEDAATDADIPVFLFHGVNDHAARIPAANWFFDRGGRKGDKAWIGQWNHDSVNFRGAQWTYALLAWFDRQLKEKNVDTGPPVELFVSEGTFGVVRTGAREFVVPARRFGVEDSPSLTLRAAPDGKLTTDAVAEGSRRFSGTPQGRLTTTDGLHYTSAPVEEDVVLAGVPEMVLSASVTAPRVHLIATLYDQSPEGDRRRITQCAINPELRTNIAQRSLVVPATRYDMTPPCMAMAHHLKADHALDLRISTADADKVPTFAVDPNITVFSGGAAGGTSITVPVFEGARLLADEVPFDEE